MPRNQKKSNVHKRAKRVSYKVESALHFYRVSEGLGDKGSKLTRYCNHCLFQKPLTVPTRADLDAVGSLEEGARLSTGSFSIIGRATLG